MENKENYVVPELDIVVLEADPLIDSDPLSGPIAPNTPNEG